MISLRLDLRQLRLLLAAVAVTLVLIAAAPHGASAAGTNNAEFNCNWEGGTWTTSGTTGYCKGLGKGKDTSATSTSARAPASTCA